MPRVTNHGGAQPGAGKPAGAITRHAGMPTGAATSPVEPATVPDRAIDPAVLSAVRLRAHGVTYSEIARRLGRDWETAKRWCTNNQDLVDAEVDRMLPKDLMRPLVPAAVAIQRAILEPGPDDRLPTLELQAATAERVLDRYGGKAPITQEVKHSGGVVIQVLHGEPSDDVAPRSVASLVIEHSATVSDEVSSEVAAEGS